MANVKLLCPYCGKKCHKKGISNHKKHCHQRPILGVEETAYTPDRYAQGVKDGREAANNDLKQRSLSTYVDALKASATMLDAVAHMITERML